jgi:tetratricopeptide (TPR) repeat protein
VIRDDPVSLRRLQPDVPRDLETICCKCLEKNPAKRYLSAAELASDIDRFLAGHPILARRSGPVERATKWSRRNPAWAVAITIGALAAVGIVAGTALHNRQLQAEIKRTNESAAEAQRQKSQALANFNKTHETLLGILTRLWQESQLSDDAINRDLRESLLQTMLRYYNEVPLDQADSDPDVRLTKALVDFNAAHVHHYLEEYDIAEEQFRRALPTLEELATAHPNNAGYRRWWALCCFRLGVTLNLSSDTKQAAEWLRQALVVLEPAPKDDLNIRTLKARCHMELAQLYRPNDLAAAELQAVHGVALWKSILSEEPGNDEYRWNLCTALNTLAQLVVGDGNLQKGEALVVESASAASKWSGAANSYYVLGSRTDMADSYRFLGFGAAEQQQDDAALAYLATAGRLLDDVFKVNPRFSEARGIANGVYWIRAMLHQKMGMQDKALGDWDRAVEFGDGGLRDIAWIQRAKYRLDLGDYKKAASEADELLASRELAREHLFELARVYCDCATAADLSESLNSDEQAREKDELAARAVQCLARCQAADFFSDAKHRQMLQTASFEVLRGRPDFQKLLDEMAGVADER